MAQQIINVGSGPDTGTGDPLRTSMQKVNDNTTDLYQQAETNATAASDAQDSADAAQLSADNAQTTANNARRLRTPPSQRPMTHRTTQTRPA